MKTILKITIALVAASLAIVIILGAFTFPKEILTFPISFTIGADVKRETMEVPFMNDRVMVEVVISSGSALWNARIFNGEETVWSHSAAQGDQTTYNSGWLQISSGLYNFSFATVGAGSLLAEITVTSKGGFW
ncbi:MAG: hypothetical protein NWE84_02080 [Candidatus Bathyarchaeota archaeon]|nr:hypothetical protein [Candidatus Bathyarchaeota archaeon]